MTLFGDVELDLTDRILRAYEHKAPWVNRIILGDSLEFCKKIDKIASSGYSPELDDGVGKNIAPLQKEKMLKTEVLTKKELEIFLNADW